MPDRLKTPEIYLAAVQNNGSALKYVPDDLKTAELCLVAVRKSCKHLVKLSQRFVNDSPYFIENCYPDFPKDFWLDQECLALVPLKFWDSEEIFIALGKYASKEIREALKTLEICLAAVQNNCFAIEMVPKEFITPEFYCAAVERNGESLRIVPEDLKTPALCLAAAQQGGRALEYVPEKLKTPELCLAAVQQDGTALMFVPIALRTPEILRAAEQSRSKKQNDG